MSRTRQDQTYRVTAFLLQAGTVQPNNDVNRHFRNGDILPSWIDQDEVRRWEADGLVEAVEQ